MIKIKCSYILLLFLFFSCTTEKINLSPLGDHSSGSNAKETLRFNGSRDMIIYSSEITNLIASFPKFRNDGVNLEVTALKTHLRNYVNALKMYNITETEKAYDQFEKSYKKLQKLRRFLNPDEDEVLNRYLVRIKTNINQLNSNIVRDTVSSL